MQKHPRLQIIMEVLSQAIMCMYLVTTSDPVCNNAVGVIAVLESALNGGCSAIDSSDNTNQSSNDNSNGVDITKSDSFSNYGSESNGNDNTATSNK